MQDQHGSYTKVITCYECKARSFSAMKKIKGKDLCARCAETKVYCCKRCGEYEFASFRQKFSGYCEVCCALIETCVLCKNKTDEVRKHNGQTYCPKCFDGLYVDCKSCGKILEKNSGIEHSVEERDEVTEEIFTKKVYVCEECSKQECVCDRCGKQAAKYLGYFMSNRWFCSEKCYSNWAEFCCDYHSVYTCTKCSAKFLDEFDPRTEQNKQCFCPKCANK
jgi:hypothetical protein